jgi:uncharacterized phage protein (TIGR02216 family)
MTAGLGLLKLTPQAFWAMTPRELASAVAFVSGAYGMPGAPTRDDLVALMRRFPDLEDRDDG